MVNDWDAAWDALPSSERAARKARQGVRYGALEDLAVLDPETLEPVPRDGASLGEVMFRGNVVMKGYLKNRKATEEAFKGGWFHSGDLGERHGELSAQVLARLPLWWRPAAAVHLNPAPPPRVVAAIAGSWAAAHAASRAPSATTSTSAHTSLALGAILCLDRGEDSG